MSEANTRHGQTLPRVARGSLAGALVALAAVSLAGCSAKVSPVEPGESSAVAGISFEMTGVYRAPEDLVSSTVPLQPKPEPRPELEQAVSSTTTMPNIGGGSSGSGSRIGIGSFIDSTSTSTSTTRSSTTATSTTITVSSSSTTSSSSTLSSTTSSSSATSTTTTTGSSTTVTSTTSTPIDLDRSALASCISDQRYSGLEAMENKGLCLDSLTFQDCPNTIPAGWPNTDGESVASLRLYKPWDPAWGSDYKRSKAWSVLIAWVKKNNVKVLLGTEVTCFQEADEEMWFWTMELMKMLGKDHVMAIAIGNDMDIFKSSKSWDETDCNDKLWNGRYWRTLQHRVRDMDLNGFTDTKVTIAWSLGMLASAGTPDQPFREDNIAKANTLVKQASSRWPDRWVWTFNTYSIYDHKLWPTSEQDCIHKTFEAISIDPVKRTLQEVRRRIQLVTGRSDDTLWIGENGWSSSGPGSLKSIERICPGYASVGSLGAAYSSFLKWDLSLGNGMKAVDHAFFFSIHDDPKKGSSFGLISTCTNTSCKVQSPRDKLEHLAVRLV